MIPGNEINPEAQETFWIGWAAGIVDGEGTIFLRKTKKRKHWELRVSAGNTDPRMSLHLQQMFGGAIRRYQPKGLNRRPIWHWSISDRGAERCLRAVFTRLRLKKEQAEIGLSFRELSSQRRGKSNSVQIEADNRWLEQQLKDLKYEIRSE